RGLCGHATGRANRASAGQSGGGDSNGAAADRPESAGPRVCNVPGSSRQGGFAAAVSGAIAGWVCGLRAVTRVAGDLRGHFVFGESAGAGNWDSDGPGGLRSSRAEPHSSAYAWISCRGVGAGNGSIARSVERGGKLVVRRNVRRSGHIYRDGSAADCGGCPRWVFSRAKSFANRSDGGIASELRKQNECVRQDADTSPSGQRQTGLGRKLNSKS